MEDNNLIMQDYLKEHFGSSESEDAINILQRGLLVLKKEVINPECFLDKNSIQPLANKFNICLLNTDIKCAVRSIKEALENGIDIENIYLNVFQSSQ